LKKRKGGTRHLKGRGAPKKRGCRAFQGTEIWPRWLCTKEDAKANQKKSWTVDRKKRTRVGKQIPCTNLCPVLGGKKGRIPPRPRGKKKKKKDPSKKNAAYAVKKPDTRQARPSRPKGKSFAARRAEKEGPMPSPHGKKKAYGPRNNPTRGRGGALEHCRLLVGREKKAGRRKSLLRRGKETKSLQRPSPSVARPQEKKMLTEKRANPRKPGRQKPLGGTHRTSLNIWKKGKKKKASTLRKKKKAAKKKGICLGMTRGPYSLKQEKR